MKVKGEERRFKNQIVEYKLQLHAHNASGFDSWVVLKNLRCDKHIVDIIKNGKGIISMKIFDGYIHNGKKTNTSDLTFRCGMTHFCYSLKKLRKTFILQKESLETEMIHDEIDGNNYKDKKYE